ncbi:carbohydrate ABC transporter permease [Cohnella lupini]|uniref:Carbohydrate ABC transporter membrane protein 1 (CUT1 family) n=1 Tax=Cohnella lupini TaxID=1294267 RepID=A0A3D9IT84_9BACL|nr:sugar ABC transporter permease [Cohnella lupini]RED64719.1 carbohydrate ABC transporter membrane protein 1 (CUT1 family) [Cohnella lupini]
MDNQPKRLNQRKWSIHLFPIPALAIYLLFIVYPIIAAFSYSLYDWQGIKRLSFVGVSNFKKLLTVEPFNTMFQNALEHNVIYFVVQMVVQNGFAFLLAYFIYQRIKGSGFLKVAYFLPRLLSVIVVGFLWKLILNPTYGTLNVLLDKLGLDALALTWLGDPNTALLSIILVNCWFGVGLSLLIFLAGLQSIPSEIIEAARLDGVKGFRMIATMILPLIMQPLIMITVLTFIQSFEAFELVYAMQGSMGGPYYSTDTLAVFFYRTAFGGSSDGSASIGIGSALAVVMFALIAVITAFFLALTRKVNRS